MYFKEIQRSMAENMQAGRVRTDIRQALRNHTILSQLSGEDSSEVFLCFLIKPVIVSKCCISDRSKVYRILSNITFEWLCSDNSLCTKLR